MKTLYKNLGKVCPTPKGDWDNQKEYERIDIVIDSISKNSYIAKKDVPIGIEITNQEYWQQLTYSVDDTAIEDIKEDIINYINENTINTFIITFNTFTETVIDLPTGITLDTIDTALASNKIIVIKDLDAEITYFVIGYYFDDSLNLVCVDGQTGNTVLAVIYSDNTYKKIIKNNNIESTSKITSTATKVGELEINTDISGKTAIEILDMMLDAEYAPKWTDATISVIGNNTLKSVGDTVPDGSPFGISGITASATTTIDGEAYTANGGSITASAAQGASLFKAGDTVTVAITIPYICTASYKAGSVQVKTSKGNPTNKTAANATTKVANATNNSNIDSTTYTIKAITKTSNATLVYTYPIYTPTESNGSALNLVLSTATSNTVTPPASNSSAPLIWSVPASFTGVKIEYYDSVAQTWGDITSECVLTTINRTIGSTNFSVSYNTYTYNKAAGSRQYRISFTRA